MNTAAFKTVATAATPATVASKRPMQAKFEVYSVTKFTNGVSVKLTAVTNGSPDDNSFSTATPSGTLEMFITAPAGIEYFEPGAKHLLTFSAAE